MITRIHNCFRCEDTGWIVAIKKENNNIYSFKCFCPVAERRKLSNSIPIWGDELMKDFKPDFENKINKNGRNEWL